MRWIKFLITTIMLLGVLLLGLLFAVENDMPVRLDLLFVELPEWPLSVWLFGSFALGALLGLLSGLLGLMRLRARNAVISRKLTRMEKELDTIRTQALKS